MAERKKRIEKASFPIVGVGASAGGLEAFTQLLAHLPTDTGMAFVLIQHLDPEHESALVQILGRSATLPVQEAVDGVRVAPNQVYVIPPNAGLTIEQGALKLQPRKAGPTPPHAIDGFFEALAEDQRERAIGVVLSGTATDGTLGLEAIKAEGGLTFAQDASAKQDSMPRSAIAAGVVDFVLDPAAIANELARIAKHPFLARPYPVPQREDDAAEATAHEDDDTPLPSGGSPDVLPDDDKLREEAAENPDGEWKDETYKRILLLLRNHSGVDFSLYRSTTIQRRIARRLVVAKQNGLEEYAKFLKGNAQELDALYSDVLISVTSFFRNPEAFDALQREVLPGLLKVRSEDPVRVWVLGCSTGQEAYSIAMAFVEAVEKAPVARRLQIFATDLNEKLLDKARSGLYAKSLSQDVSPERLRRFFIEEGGGYRVSKALREMVVFARQNLVADPPFSRMDLISCRNLLIYLEPTLQKRALPTFHYALRPGGFLMLGASESIGTFTDLFEPVDRKAKIFVKKPALTPMLHLPANRDRPERGPTVPQARPGEPPSPPAGFRGELNAQREADRVAVAQFGPPGVLIDDALQVIQFRGPTGAYLEPPAGKASFDVLKMAREGLMLPLRNAINQAKKQGKTTRAENVRVERDGETRTIALQVIPLKNVAERCYLVVFEEPDGALQRKTPKPPTLDKDQEASRITELESDLAETREYLQAVQEQGEASNEELQAANEEVQSANEELQSINEELETSKEELESANEELTTVNEEMANRNAELNRLNNDLVNLQNSIKIPILLVGRDLTLRRYSPEAEKRFDLMATDPGKPISHLRHDLVTIDQGKETPLDLESVAARVVASVREEEFEVKSRKGRWYSLRIRPYMTLDSKVDGAVIVLVDIDDLKRAEEKVAAARDLAQNTVDTVRESMLVLDRDLRVESANQSFYQTFAVAPNQTVGRLIYELGNRQWDIPKLRELLEEILSKRTTIEDYQAELDFEDIGPKVMLLNARRILVPGQESARILLAIEDVTERTAGARTLAISEDRFRRLTEVSNEVIYRHNPDWTEMLQLTGGGFLADTAQPDPDWFDKYIHPDDQPAIWAEIQAAIRERRPFELEHRVIRADGSIGWTLSRSVPVLDDEGEIVEWFGAASDVTDRVQAQAAVARFQETFFHMVEDAPFGMYIVDVDFRIAQMNRSAQRHAFANVDPVIGRPFAETLRILWPEDVAYGIEAIFRHTLETGEPYRSQDFIETRADTDAIEGYEWELQRFVMSDGRFGVACYYFDSTPLREAEMALRESEQAVREFNEDLEQKIKTRTRELLTANEQLQGFTYSVAHDLRQQIRGISSNASILLLDMGEALDEENQHTLKRMVANAHRLATLVDDLLRYAHLGRQEPNRTEIDLTALSEDAAATLIERGVARAGTRIKIAPNLTLRADRTMIRIVMENLLENACKYSVKAAQPVIEVGKEGEAFFVRDNGIGFDMAYAHKLFQPFERLHRDGEFAGTGIGLANVKRVIERHGGRVWAEGTLGKGATIFFTLP